MIYFFKSFSVNAYVYVYIFLNYYDVITKRINLYHKGKEIFPDNIFTKNQQYFYVKLKIIKLFENFLHKFFLCTYECIYVFMCVHVRVCSSSGAVHALNDGPRQIETAECRSN